jgi:hypothetical protein
MPVKKRGKGRVSRFIPFLVMYSKAVYTPREYQWDEAWPKPTLRNVS